MASDNLSDCGIVKFSDLLVSDHSIVRSINPALGMSFFIEWPLPLSAEYPFSGRPRKNTEVSKTLISGSFIFSISSELNGYEDFYSSQSLLMIIETPKNNYSPLPTSGSLFRIYQIRSNECISYARIQICPLDEPLVIDNVFHTPLGSHQVWAETVFSENGVIASIV